MQIAVIGAGPAGMVAAIEAARNGADVVLYEKNKKVGKKLATTGNGRCNYTNLVMDAEKYRGEDPQFAWKVISSFDERETIAYFQKLGIEPKMRGGYVYPNSDQASSVVSALLDELEHQKVMIRYESIVKEIRRENGKFLVMTQEGKRGFDRVILTAGSCAAPATGSDGSGYRMAEKLGLRKIWAVPALTAIRCSGTQYKDMAGVRADAQLTLKSGKTVLAEERGELQLTDYGISGIPVFQISRFAAYALERKEIVAVYISFFPGKSREEILRLLEQRKEQLFYKPAGKFLQGLLNQKLGDAFLKLCNIDAAMPVAELTTKNLKALSGMLTEYKAEAVSVNPFAQAQCAAGGIATGELNPETMEAWSVPGLYLAGEILDVDGICGGYNLQWAWSSGILAGRSASIKQQ
ncbi:MAG TPA: aminoacetone oxidase family FAD-binding enzyme [Oribacterium sp.]|nr:aminoacetone oxidase family FAD-binding enzyme [Oribacterium sp.]